MGISKFIKTVCVQQAVYWGGAVPDSYGGYSFNAGTEIMCRWEDKIQNITNKDGKLIVSKAEILIPTDVDVNGYIHLGAIEDLDSAYLDNPLLLDTAYEIQSISKVPMIKSTTEFVRKIYL